MLSGQQFNSGATDHTNVPIWRVGRWLVPLAYLLAAMAFAMDLVRANLLAYGIFYAPMVVTGLVARRRSTVWFLCALTCALVVIGAFFPRIDPDHSELIGNRILSIVAILLTAVFVNYARNAHEILAMATKRAEAAERIKSEVLAQLSREIRTPLHSMLGVLTLTMAAGKPDQQVVGRVRNDARQLLASIDNLIDLTQIEDRILRSSPIDIATIARDATEEAGRGAQERQITVSLETPEPGTNAVGDGWAIRRILDNLLANAVRLTPPGGTVSVAVRRDHGTITASVADGGSGLPPAVIAELDAHTDAADDLALQTTGATGLALSQRLARAMNGRLTARNAPAGAVLAVTLPAA